MEGLALIENRRLRIAVMSRGTVFPKWQADALTLLLEAPGVELVGLIVDPRTEGRGARQKSIDLLEGRHLLWNLYNKFYVRSRSRAQIPVDMTSELGSLSVIEAEIQKQDPFSEVFSTADVARVKALGPDIIVRFAFGILRGEILTAARLGVWSFHHGDERQFRGVPPGFWEIHTKSAFSGVILQRLTDRLDGGIVLERAFVRAVHHSYVRSLDSMLMTSSALLLRAVKRVLSGDYSRVNGSPSTTTAQIRTRPSNRQSAAFLLRLCWRFVGAQIRGLFMADVWNIGVVETTIDRVALSGEPLSVLWIEELPRGRYLADPFGLPTRGSTSVLAEEFDHRAQRGTISTIAVSGLRGAPVPVLVTDEHRSYPFVFVDGDEVFLVPESFRSRTVDIFRARSYPDEWEHFARLLHDFPAVDPTVFHHAGRWWLFCTHGKSGPNSELWAWFAPRLDGPWKEHSLNPIKIDVRSSRPAGTPFVASGHLYRPAQDCSKTYGGRIVINRLLELDPRAFAEEAVSVIEPPPGPYPDGLHTISSAGDHTLVDGKRRQFLWPAFRHELRARLSPRRRKRRE